MEKICTINKPKNTEHTIRILKYILELINRGDQPFYIKRNN